MPSAPKRTAIGKRHTRTAAAAAAAAIRDEPRPPVTIEDADTQVTAVAAAPEKQQQERESSQQNPATPEKPAGKGEAKSRTVPAGKTDVALYWRGDTYQETRRAFWYDYSRFDGEGPDHTLTLRAWIAHAIDVHNQKSTQERAAIVRALGKVDLTAGESKPRPFALDSLIVAEMTKQLIRDRQTEGASELFPEWPSTSNYVEAAVRVQIQRAKEQAPGGKLPEPPPRLPIKGRPRRKKGDPEEKSSS